MPLPNRVSPAIRAKLAVAASCILVAAAGMVVVAPSGVGAATTTNDPSGVPIPTTAPAHMVLAFADDFTGTSLSNKWGKYSGVPGGDPGGLWDPTHIQVGGGMVVLRGYKNSKGKYVTAGISTKPGFNQKYGRYLVRMRIDSGQGISFAGLLWPSEGSGPPEIDFAEDNGAAARSNISSFMHYGTKAKKEQSSRNLNVNMTKWHTLGVQWKKGRVNYTLDGHVWSTVPGNGVSSKSMYLALQTQAWNCGGSYEKCPDSSTPAEVDMDIDWVVAYKSAS